MEEILKFREKKLGLYENEFNEHFFSSQKTLKKREKLANGNADVHMFVFS